MNEFSAGSCIRFGWETFKKRPWFVIGMFLLLDVLSGAFNLNSRNNQNIHFTPTLVAVFVVLLVIAFVVTTLARMGKIQLNLRIHDAIESARFKDVWAPHPFWNYVGATVLVGLIVVAGFILLIVPGIIWGLRFMFVPYFVVEKKFGPLEAMRASSAMTYGHKWKLLGLVALVFLLNILGFVCLIVGLLVTAPVGSLAITHAYRILGQNSTSPVV